MAVGELIEIAVPLPHGPEIVRSTEYHQGVDLGTQCIHGSWGSDRNGEHQLGGACLAHHPQRGTRSTSGGHTVVDDDAVPSRHRRHRPFTAIRAAPALEFVTFDGDHLGQSLSRQLHLGQDDIVVEDVAVLCDGAHPCFGAPR